MVKRFFWTNTSNGGGYDTAILNNKSESIILLSGPPSSGKTSLLFQFAYNTVMAAQAQHHRQKDEEVVVVYICNRRKLEANPPFLSQGIDHESSHVFDRIQIKYVDDEEGINKYFAAFHMHDNFPVLVIVDDFADFFNERHCQDRYNSPRGRDLAVVRSLALCRSAIDHANEKGCCKLLLSDTHMGDSIRLLYIYKRWVSSIYMIKGDGFGSFLLKNYVHPGTTSLESKMKTKTAKYSIALQYLVLEGICENEEQ